VTALELDRPTADFTAGPALSEASSSPPSPPGMDSVPDGTDLLALGEMGIGNTTPAAAISCALFGGDAAQWTGRGTGVDGAALTRKTRWWRPEWRVTPAAAR